MKAQKESNKRLCNSITALWWTAIKLLYAWSLIHWEHYLILMQLWLRIPVKHQPYKIWHQSAGALCVCVICSPQFSSSCFCHVSVKLFSLELLFIALWLTLMPLSARRICHISVFRHRLKKERFRVSPRPCRTFITIIGTGKEVIVCSFGARVQASTALFSSHLRSFVLTEESCIKCESLHRSGVIWDLFSCQQRSKAWPNKEPIHPLVDLLCTFIQSLRWTLLFKGTTCVLM